MNSPPREGNGAERARPEWSRSFGPRTKGNGAAAGKEYSRTGCRGADGLRDARDPVDRGVRDQFRECIRMRIARPLELEACFEGSGSLLHRQ